MGPNFVLPIMPLAMACVYKKLACNCVLSGNCVLDLFIFCGTMSPIYMALRYELGLDGLLIAFSDDAYLHGLPVRVAAAITAAPALYEMVELRVG